MSLKVALENRQPVQEAFLALCEQPEAAPNRLAKTPVARQRTGRLGAGLGGVRSDPLRQLVDREKPHLGGDELQGQGQPFDGRTDRSDTWSRVRVEHEVGIAGFRSIDKEPYRVPFERPRQARRVIAGNLQRTNRPDVFTGDSQNHTASGQHNDLRSRGKEFLGQGGDLVDQVFAIVEDDKDLG